jgi:hypothetical protein
MHLDRTPVRVERRPPRLDEHGDAIRAWLANEGPSSDRHDGRP